MHRHVFLGLVAVALGLEGCNCAGREFTTRRTFSVHSQTQDPLCSADRLEVDLGSDAAFKDAKAFIARVELQKLRVEVKNPKTREDSVVTKAGGKVQVSSSQTDTALTLGTYEDVAITAGQGQDIAIDKAAAGELAKLALKSPNTFWIVADGCNDKVPAFYDFDVVLTFFAGL